MEPDQAACQDELLQRVLDEKLWLSESGQSARSLSSAASAAVLPASADARCEQAEAAGSAAAGRLRLARVKSEEFLRDLKNLHGRARLTPPPRPFLRRANRGNEGAGRRALFKALITDLLNKVVNEFNAKGQAGNGATATASEAADQAAEAWLTSTSTYYIIRELAPLLVDGLSELVAASEFVSARKAALAASSAKQVAEHAPGGGGNNELEKAEEEERMVLMPLNFLGAFLMRHNPAHPAALLRSKSRRRERAQFECSTIVHEFFAEQAVRRRMDGRRALWRTEQGKALMGIWKRHCPREGDILTLQHVRESMSVFRKHLHLADSIEPEDLFLRIEGGNAHRRATFEQYELVVGNMLRESNTMHAVARVQTKAKNKVTAWAKERAMRKLEERLDESGINAKLWFDEYADPSSNILGKQDLELCAKCMVAQLDLDVTDEETRDAIAAALNGNAFVGYEGFVRLVAELVRISAVRAEEIMESRSRRLFEARVTANVRAVQEHLQEIDRVEARLAKLRRSAASFRRGTVALAAANANPDADLDSPEMRELEPTRSQVDNQIKCVEAAIEELSQHNARLKIGVDHARRLVLEAEALDGDLECELGAIITQSRVDLDVATRRTDDVEKLFCAAKSLYQERESRAQAARDARAQEAKRQADELERQRLAELAERKRRDAEASRVAALRSIHHAGGSGADEQEEDDARRALARATLIAEEERERLAEQARLDAQRRVSRKRGGESRKRISKGDISQLSKSGNAKDLKVLLEQAAEKTADMAKLVNETDKNGSTPLMHVAWPGNLECAALLLSHGADPLATNLRLNTPLHFAFERGHVQFARLLLDHGGERALNIKNALGKTPTDLNPAMRAQLGLA